MITARADRHAAATRSRHRRIGTAGQLASFHALVLLVVLGAVVFALVRNFTSSYQAAAISQVASQLRQYEQAAASRPEGQDLQVFSKQYLEGHALPAGNTVVIALRGPGTSPTRLVVTSGYGGLITNPTVKGWIAEPPMRTAIVTSSLGETPVEIVGAPIRTGPSTVGTYIASLDLTVYVHQRARVLWLSLAGAGVALLVGALSAFYLLRRLLRTIGGMTATAEEIGSGSLDRRLGDTGTDDEVGKLASTFDSMLDRLQSAMTAQRRLLADVSHQLRTPLTVARGHLEVLGRTGVDDPSSVVETLSLVIDELDHMGSLVERLLMLGRAMEPELFDLAPLAVPAFLTDLSDASTVLADRRFELGTPPDVVIEADARMLRGALLNLVENAVHATSPHDTIALSASVDATSGVRLVVEDSGPGIPTAERDAALARYARPGARAAGGSGLGLAIAKAVALAHGGSIEIDQSPTLGGARVSIVLPVLAACPALEG